VNFTGASKVINAPVQVNHPSVTFANGGLAISTGAEIALQAQNGTLQITGPGNSITTTAAVPMEMLDVDTGTLGITFQSVSAGGSTAMFLSNITGSGGVHITGTGAPGRTLGRLRDGSSHGPAAGRAGTCRRSGGLPA